MWNWGIDSSNDNKQTGRWVKESSIAYNYATLQNIKITSVNVTSYYSRNPAHALKRWTQAFPKIVYNSFFNKSSCSLRIAWLKS